MSKRLMIFAALMLILVPVSASLGSAAATWVPIANDRTETVGDTRSYSVDGPSTQFTKPHFAREVTVAPTSTEQIRVEDTPTIRPSPPKPTVTPEPTTTSFQVMLSMPTPTPTPFPAVTNQPTATPTLRSTSASASDIRHVVIISIDGLRPDALDLAHTPTLDRLRARGAYSPHAQTVSLSITLPSHASMLSGMIPEKHGILWGLPYIGWPGMNGPTLFSVAHDAGLSTAMVFGKQKLSYLVLPNSVDKLYGTDAHDMEIKGHAVEIIEAGLPAVLFIHFPDTDRVGHAYGWMSDNQLYAVTYADDILGQILARLEDEGYLEHTLLIITADHGGHDKYHGDDSAEDRTIPWLAVGPGVQQGIIISSHIDTFDTAATALYALDLPIPEKWDGRPVLEIFQ